VIRSRQRKLDSGAKMGRGLKISDALSPHELRIEARRAETPRAAARMYAIASALEGKSRDEAARCAGMDRQALRDAVARYNAEGLDGLYDRDRPGRPRHLSRKQEAQLTKLILKGPNPEKDGISAYTLDDLVHISEEKFGVAYHPSSMSRVVRRLGFSRQKARPSHPMKDPASQEAFKKSPKNAAKNCRYTQGQAHPPVLSRRSAGRAKRPRLSHLVYQGRASTRAC